MVLLLSNIIRTNKLRKQLNDIDKRNTVSLLSIQHHCAAINRSVNEVIEMNKTLVAENARLSSIVRLTHQRVKDAYTGFFKHFDIKRLRRAPKAPAQEQHEGHKRETEERAAIIKETTNEMSATDFNSRTH